MRPRPVEGLPRRDPLIASIIEQLQDADDNMRRGNKSEAQVALISAHAAIELLLYPPNKAKRT